MPKLKANNSFSTKFTSNFGEHKKHSIQNLCKEHYRDMTQKRRRKKLEKKKIKEKNYIKI